MITKNNEYMDDGAQVLLTMNSDQTIRDMCYFRERAEIEEKYRNDLIQKQKMELATQAQTINIQANSLIEKDNALAEKDKELSAQAAIIAELQAQLASHSVLQSSP